MGRRDRPSWLRQLLAPMNLLLVLVPVAAGLHFAGVHGLWLFVASAVAIVPLAGLMGRATESLAERLGPAAGGLLNATFGNAAELIIALAVVRHGPELYPLVKASITGSIIGNLLLVLGLAMLAGGLRHHRLRFDRTSAGVGTTLLALACAGLIVPTLYFYLLRAGERLSPDELHNIEYLSEEIAVILAVVYALSIVFSLRHTYAEGDILAAPVAPHAPSERLWGMWTSLVVLSAATAGVAVLSEWLVDTVGPAGQALGLNAVFIGVIVVAAVGNAAEHSSAVWMALKGRMELAMQIAVGSSTQVALFVAPVLVFASMAINPAQPLDLHFTPLEVAALLLSVAVIALVCHDGESHWMEGVMLLALYLIFALAFYHLPTAAH